LKIIPEFYQRDNPVSNRYAAIGWAGKNHMMPRIVFLFLLLGSTRLLSAVAAAGEDGVRLRLPDRIPSGNEWALRVYFDQAPPDKQFYRLLVKIDGSPAAFADLFRGEKTTINIPAVAPGTHRLSLVWKNAPGGKAIVIRRTFRASGQ
jgi:hypothetical protein